MFGTEWETSTALVTASERIQERDLTEVTEETKWKADWPENLLAEPEQEEKAMED